VSCRMPPLLMPLTAHTVETHNAKLEEELRRTMRRLPNSKPIPPLMPPPPHIIDDHNAKLEQRFRDIVGMTSQQRLTNMANQRFANMIAFSKFNAEMLRKRHPPVPGGHIEDLLNTPRLKSQQLPDDDANAKGDSKSGDDTGDGKSADSNDTFLVQMLRVIQADHIESAGAQDGHKSAGVCDGGQMHKGLVERLINLKHCQNTTAGGDSKSAGAKGDSKSGDAKGDGKSRGAKGDDKSGGAKGASKSGGAKGDERKSAGPKKMPKAMPKVEVLKPMPKWLGKSPGAKGNGKSAGAKGDGQSGVAKGDGKSDSALDDTFFALQPVGSAGSALHLKQKRPTL
jgi:hypothetical protein